MVANPDPGLTEEVSRRRFSHGPPSCPVCGAQEAMREGPSRCTLFRLPQPRDRVIVRLRMTRWRCGGPAEGCRHRWVVRQWRCFQDELRVVRG